MASGVNKNTTQYIQYVCFHYTNISCIRDNVQIRFAKLNVIMTFKSKNPPPLYKRHIQVDEI